MIKENIQKINSEIKNSNATLIAVSKFKSNEDILEAYNTGIRDFGENHVQELIKKIDELPKDIRWHLIGHLQKNKVKYIVNKNVYLIHSVDSIDLAKEISKRAVSNNIYMNILLEVNVANEESKWGFKVDEIKDAYNQISSLPNINVQGLMTVAPHVENPEEVRKYFRKLKEINDSLNLHVLSMGMSGDYKIAIEEGSTYIRIGTVIFGARNYNK